MIARLPFAVLAMLAALALAGCGKKPGSMQPPAGAEDTDYPRSYPPPTPQPPA